MIISNLTHVEQSLGHELVLLPRPKRMEYSRDNKNNFLLTANSFFHDLNLENPGLFLNELNDFLMEMKEFKINAAKLPEELNTRIEGIKESEFLDPHDEECYNLEVKNHLVLIEGTSEKAVFHGLQTFIQILKNSIIQTHGKDEFRSNFKRNEIIIPQISIKDVPDLKIRGIAQDIARGQVFTLENAKRYLKIMSHYKMNFYCLYMEDMFTHQKHPEIGKNRGALTHEEIKELDAFAKERFIELVPIFECLGHVDNILQHETYQDLGEFPGAHSFDISNPRVLDFVEDYISEMSKCFSTKYFHMGCDESFDVGKYRSKDLIEKIGKNKALIEYYEKLHAIAKKHGNEYVIMYDDFVRKNEEILQGLRKDIILMYWDYSPKKSFPDLKKLLDAGYKVIVSPSMLNWQRHFPDNKNASKNIINFIKNAFRYRNEGCLGVINSTWGDMRYYSLRENEIFGGILSNSIAWNVNEFNYDQFIKDHGFLFHGFLKEDIELYHEMFKKLSNSVHLYYRLSISFPPLFFTYFFKHPFPVKKIAPLFENYKKLGQVARECLEIQKKLQPRLLLEKNHFEYLQFSARLALFLEKKIDLSVKISELLNELYIQEEELDILIFNLNKIKEELIQIRHDYERLWLRAAKRPCLDNILDLFDFLIRTYEEKVTQIKNGIYFVNPYLESEWIWTTEKQHPLHPRYFRKKFSTDKPIKKAMIQCIAHNYMKVHVNGHFIGQVLSRYSMSILPIINRVKVFDITPYLKKGENILSVEAYNFDGYKGAINVFGQIQFEDNEVMEIHSDPSWKCHTGIVLKEKDWTTLKFNDEQWKSSFSHGPPPNLNGDIFKPNLLKGEKSFTQDYFGIESYLSNFTGETDERKLEEMIKQFNPYGN